MIFYTVTRTSLGARARVLTAQLRGAGPDGGPEDEAEVIADAEVLQPLGLFARPHLTEHTEALAVESGDEVMVLWTGDKSGGGGAHGVFSASAAPVGCTILYGAKEGAARVTLSPEGDAKVACKAGRSMTMEHPSGASIVIDGNGAIQVTAASGRDITFNAGTKKVARVEDGLDVGTLTATAGPWPVVFAYVPGTGTPAAAPPGGVSLQGVIQSAAGAARVKG